MSGGFVSLFQSISERWCAHLGRRLQNLPRTETKNPNSECDVKMGDEKEKRRSKRESDRVH